MAWNEAFDCAVEDCDGIVCGTNFKKGSIPADRLDKVSLKELLKEIFEEFSKEDWFIELICNLGCEDKECVMDITDASGKPLSSLSFEAEGGTAYFYITTSADWSITIE